MRIALVSPYDWSVPSGVNRHIGQLAAQFRRWDHEVTILAPASDPSGAEGQCIVMGRPRAVPASGSLARISFTWKSRAIETLLEGQDFDVVHLHEPLMPLLPYQVLRHSNAANVGTFHAAKEGGNRIYGYTRPLTRRWFRKLDGKIAVSPAAARLVGRYFPGYFNLIPNGIDFAHFATASPLPEFEDGCFNLLFVGRPEKRKGLKYVLRAFKRIREAEPNTRLIVVGAGSFARYETAHRTARECGFSLERALRRAASVPPQRPRLLLARHRQRKPRDCAHGGDGRGPPRGSEQYRRLRGRDHGRGQRPARPGEG